MWERCQWWCSGCARSVVLLLSLDLSWCFKFRFANLENLWIGHKKHDVAVLSDSGCCSHVLLLQRFFSRSQWVPCCGREQLCEVRLGAISDAKAANVFCIFVLRFVSLGPLVMSACLGAAG